jgi:homoisocitrate dehydrogenase
MLRQITRHISRSGLNYSKRIALIPADGIGVEVVPAAVRVINHAIKESGATPLEYVNLEAGWGTFEKTGHALPQKTIDALRECDGALFGAVSSPSHKVKGYSSPIVAMRNHLDLFANLRPIKSPSKEINGSRPDVDMFIVRENTECLYVKQERLEDDGEKAIANRVITKKASKRIARVAFELAETRRNKVTIVHKRYGITWEELTFQ